MPISSNGSSLSTSDDWVLCDVASSSSLASGVVKASKRDRTLVLADLSGSSDIHLRSASIIQADLDV